MHAPKHFQEKRSQSPAVFILVATVIAIAALAFYILKGPGEGAVAGPADGGEAETPSVASDVPLEPFDESGEPFGDTPDEPEVLRPAAAPPDPVIKSAEQRSTELQMPSGYDVQWDTAPEIWDAADTDERGWMQSFAIHFTLTPQQGEEEPPPELAGGIFGEASVIYVGDQSDFRDSLISGEDETMSVTEVQLINGEGALTKPRAGGGPARLDIAVNGELIVIIVNRPGDEDKVYGPSDAEMVELANAYISNLYSE